MRMLSRCSVLCLSLLFLGPVRGEALERLCDTAFEDCRAPLRELIRNETQGIDVAFWFMTDARYAHDLLDRHRAGVPVRVIMDDRTSAAGNSTILQMLRDGGVPMRQKTTGGIAHWKMMLFHGQNTVQLSGANYSPQAFVPIQPYVNYVDEVIYFTERASIVNSFRTRFDDVWVSTTGFSDYANVSGPLARRYPVSPIDPELNFVPWQDFRARSVSRYRAETQRIDAIIYRITDRAHTDALIEAVGRGVRVRILTEPVQYRDPSRLWHAWNVDRLYAAGVELRHRAHEGLTHEKLTLLHSQGMTVFGSSNWTGPSATSQLEHNLFTRDAAFFNWSRDHFERKWNNAGPAVDTQPFVPLPPQTPLLNDPTDAAASQPLTVTLRWYAGPWAHKYDVFLGTAPGALTKIADDEELGPSERSTDWVTWRVEDLAPNTTYYWRVVSKTMANLSRQSALWSFSTGAQPTAPPPPPPPTLLTPADGAVNQPRSITLAWQVGDTAERYDLYLGADPVNLSRLVSDRDITGSRSHQTWTVNGLAEGTTYYWRVVVRTGANLSRSSATWAFTTTGPPAADPPPPVPPPPAPVPPPQTPPPGDGANEAVPDAFVNGGIWARLFGLLRR